MRLAEIKRLWAAAYVAFHIQQTLPSLASGAILEANGLFKEPEDPRVTLRFIQPMTSAPSMLVFYIELANISTLIYIGSGVYMMVFCFLKSFSTSTASNRL